MSWTVPARGRARRRSSRAAWVRPQTAPSGGPRACRRRRRRRPSCALRPSAVSLGAASAQTGRDSESSPCRDSPCVAPALRSASRGGPTREMRPPRSPTREMRPPCAPTMPVTAEVACHLRSYRQLRGVRGHSRRRRGDRHDENVPSSVAAPPASAAPRGCAHGRCRQLPRWHATSALTGTRAASGGRLGPRSDPPHAGGADQSRIAASRAGARSNARLSPFPHRTAALATPHRHVDATFAVRQGQAMMPVDAEHSLPGRLLASGGASAKGWAWEPPRP